MRRYLLSNNVLFHSDERNGLDNNTQTTTETAGYPTS